MYHHHQLSSIVVILTILGSVLSASYDQRKVKRGAFGIGGSGYAGLDQLALLAAHTGALGGYGAAGLGGYNPAGLGAYGAAGLGGYGTHGLLGSASAMHGGLFTDNLPLGSHHQGLDLFAAGLTSPYGAGYGGNFGAGYGAGLLNIGGAHGLIGGYGGYSGGGVASGVNLPNLSGKYSAANNLDLSALKDYSSLKSSLTATNVKLSPTQAPAVDYSAVKPTVAAEPVAKTPVPASNTQGAIYNHAVTAAPPTYTSPTPSYSAAPNTYSSALNSHSSNSNSYSSSPNSYSSAPNTYSSAPNSYSSASNSHSSPSNTYNTASNAYNSYNTPSSNYNDPSSAFNAALSKYIAASNSYSNAQQSAANIHHSAQQSASNADTPKSAPIYTGSSGKTYIISAAYGPTLAPEAVKLNYNGGATSGSMTAAVATPTTPAPVSTTEATVGVKLSASYSSPSQYQGVQASHPLFGIYGTAYPPYRGSHF